MTWFLLEKNPWSLGVTKPFERMFTPPKHVTLFQDGKWRNRQTYSALKTEAG